MSTHTPAINRRILLIDDERPVHDAYHTILAADATDDSDFDALSAEMFGDDAPPQQPASGGVAFELTSAYQGEEGVELCSAAVAAGKPFAVAFVDMRMPPGIDGLETVCRLWEVDPELQVVICSAYTDYSWDEVRAKLGYSSRLLILKKPFENVEVHQMAAALTEKWSLSLAAGLRLETLDEAVTERTRELEQAQKQLLQAEKMASVGQLAAGVAHEINNPIGYIASNLNTLTDYVSDLTQVLQAFVAWQESADAGAEDAEARRAAAAALAKKVDLDFLLEDLESLVCESTEGTDRVRKIVSDLRDFSHADTPDIKAEDLNQLIEKTLSVAQNEVKYKADVVTAFGEIPPLPCFGGKLSQVVLNLVVNAAQAIEEHGVITVRTGVEEGKAWISVADTGRGMPPEVMSKVFDPFFTTKDVGKGTGLGLNLAYNIIQSHNGSIGVESEVGRGTTFRIELPLAGPGEVAKEVSHDQAA